MSQMLQAYYKRNQNLIFNLSQLLNYLQSLFLNYLDDTKCLNLIINDLLIVATLLCLIFMYCFDIPIKNGYAFFILSVISFRLSLINYFIIDYLYYQYLFDLKHCFYLFLVNLKLFYLNLIMFDFILCHYFFVFNGNNLDNHLHPFSGLMSVFHFLKL